MQADGSTRFGPIVILGSDRFQREVLEDYERIYATRTGRLVLEAYARTRKTTVVQPIPIGRSWSFGDDFTLPDDSERARNARAFMGGPRGSNAHILYNPTYTSPYQAQGWNGAVVEVPREPWMILAHEQIHAMHMAYGELMDSWSALDAQHFPNGEEERTINGGAEPDDTMTENALQSELGNPPRISHDNHTARTYMDQDGLWYRLRDGEHAPGTRIDPLNDRVNQ